MVWDWLVPEPLRSTESPIQTPHIKMHWQKFRSPYLPLERAAGMGNHCLNRWQPIILHSHTKLVLCHINVHVQRLINHNLVCANAGVVDWTSNTGVAFSQPPSLYISFFITSSSLQRDHQTFKVNFSRSWLYINACHPPVATRSGVTPLSAQTSSNRRPNIGCWCQARCHHGMPTIPSSALAIVPSTGRSGCVLTAYDLFIMRPSTFTVI